jgi:hypothetical protein
MQSKRIKPKYRIRVTLAKLEGRVGGSSKQIKGIHQGLAEEPERKLEYTAEHSL